MPVLGVHLTKGQPDPKADQMSSWPEVVPWLATRCLYWGVHLIKGQPTQISMTLGHEMSLPGGMFDHRSA